MWILASAQSTRFPFIQILPVPKLMAVRLLARKLSHLLRFAAKRARIRARVQGLAAMPAEARLRRFARAKARVDVLHVRADRRGCRLGCDHLSRPAGRRGAAGGPDVPGRSGGA